MSSIAIPPIAIAFAALRPVAAPKFVGSFLPARRTVEALELKPFYWNFDGLDVAFQGRIPQDLVDALEEAKAEAQNTRAAVFVE